MTFDEVASRLPSALAGLSGIVLLMVLTRRLYDGRTAIFAGCILVTCYGYVFWSRIASADIETVTGVLAALTLYFCNHERRPGRWIVGLWLIMAVTGSHERTARLCPTSARHRGLFAYCAGVAQSRRQALEWRVEGQGRFVSVAQNEWFFNRMTLLAMTIAALIYLLPFAASLLVTNSNLGLFMVLRENVLRFVEPFDHKGPIYLYAYTIFVLMAPWCLFLPAALVQAHSKLAGKSDRFVLAYLGDIYFFHSLGLQARLLLAAHFARGGDCSRAVVRFAAGKLEPVGARAWCREATC